MGKMYEILNQKAITSVKSIPPQEGVFAPFPAGVSQIIIDGFTRHGITSLYAHQAETIESILQQRHTIITTSTASGKSLTYTIPLLNSFLENQDATALYLTPAKALGQNQKKTIQEIADQMHWPGKSPSIEVCDGDTPFEKRKEIMRQGNIIVTTPDMLHYSMLPQHNYWARVLQNLKYIVIDEAHSYRGILGNNVSHVLRRLRRICMYYRSYPVFVLCTATIANPQEFAKNLTGLDHNIISKNTAPSGVRHFVFYQPDEPSFKESSQIMGKYVTRDRRVIVFGRSRRVVEMMYTKFMEEYPQHKSKVTPYKGTYTPEMRRQLENQLFKGETLGVISTSALELGVDIGDLDVCVLSGFPGSISSSWQMAGRVGRKGQESMVVLVANDDPLDQYLINNPEYFFGQPCEKAIVNPSKLQFMVEHLLAAAQELPLSKQDNRYWGKQSYYSAVRFLLSKGLIEKVSCDPILYRPSNRVEKFGLRGDRNSFRGIYKERALELYEYKNLLTDAYPGAIVWVRGKSYRVDRIDYANKQVNLVDLPPHLKWHRTRPRLDTDIKNIKPDRENAQAKVPAYAGVLTIASSLRGYYLIAPNGDKTSCDISQPMEPHRLRTTGIWVDVPAETGTGVVHALEHLMHIVVPWMAMCERADIGTFMEGSRIYLYDNYEGGVGLAESVLDNLDEVLERCYKLVIGCDCDLGCPSCIQIPQCLSQNEGLDKVGVIKLLSKLLGRSYTPSAAPSKQNTKSKITRTELRLEARKYEQKIV